ncbi:Ig-like domain-containing protein [Deinococcus frigens]
MDTEKPTLDVKANPMEVVTTAPVSLDPNAKDNVAIRDVKYYTNNKLEFTATKAPYSATVSFSPNTRASVQIRVVATDTSGNSAEQTITLTVDTPADVTPPVIASFTASTSTVTTQSEVTFTTSVSDDDEVLQVRFYDNDALFGFAGKAPYTVSKKFYPSDNGPHTIRVIAEDFSGNQSEETLDIMVDIVATTPPPPNSPRYPHGYSPPCYSPAVIKGNESSSGERIYHVPGGAYYSRTVPEVCYITETDAQADGFRRSSR